MWLKLTKTNPDDDRYEIWINMALVKSIMALTFKDRTITDIMGTCWVVETPEQIMEMISRAKEA